MKVTIEQYSDYYSEWYGLADGTILPLGDPRGQYYRKCGEQPALPAKELDELVLGMIAYNLHFNLRP